MLTSFQLYYFGNCISFIQFIFIMNFMPLLGGRMISAPTELCERLQCYARAKYVFYITNSLPDINFPFSIFNFTFN